MKILNLLPATSLLLIATACTKEELRAPTAYDLRTTTGQAGDNTERCDALGALLDGEWRLFQLDGGSIEPPMGSERPWLRLNTDPGNTLEGFGGCDMLFGEHIVGCGALAFIGLGSGHMLCPATSDLENAFLAMLAGVDAYGIDGDRLTLLADGEEVALLVRLSLAIDGPEGALVAEPRRGTPPTVPDLFD